MIRFEEILKVKMNRPKRRIVVINMIQFLSPVIMSHLLTQSFRRCHTNFLLINSDHFNQIAFIWINRLIKYWFSYEYLPFQRFQFLFGTIRRVAKLWVQKRSGYSIVAIRLENVEHSGGIRLMVISNNLVKLINSHQIRKLRFFLKTSLF